MWTLSEHSKLSPSKNSGRSGAVPAERAQHGTRGGQLPARRPPSPTSASAGSQQLGRLGDQSLCPASSAPVSRQEKENLPSARVRVGSEEGMWGWGCGDGEETRIPTSFGERKGEVLSGLLPGLSTIK